MQPLIRALERQGWSVWWERGAILPGQNLDQVIEEALRPSGHQLFIRVSSNQPMTSGLEEGPLLAVLEFVAKSSGKIER